VARRFKEKADQLEGAQKRAVRRIRGLENTVYCTVLFNIKKRRLEMDLRTVKKAVVGKKKRQKQPLPPPSIPQFHYM